jgi:hypothetical protein
MIAQWELLHKHHNFATHIPSLFFKVIKILIHFIISTSWVWVYKGKLLGSQLQAHDVINKPNLDVILHSHLGYMDISGLCTPSNYLNRSRKDVFAMNWQLGLPTFFVTFTSVESKWISLLKCLYDLNSKKLGLNIPFDKLKPKHVADFISCDPITCARYYDNHMKSFCTLCMKDSSIFGHILNSFFVT